jgi:hypothetical protein
MPGLKTVRLQDGTHLNYVDENTFKNAVTGELLSRTTLAEKERKKALARGLFVNIVGWPLRPGRRNGE